MKKLVMCFFILNDLLRGYTFYNDRFSERESPIRKVWDESESGYGVPLITGRFSEINKVNFSVLKVQLYNSRKVKENIKRPLNIEVRALLIQP